MLHLPYGSDWQITVTRVVKMGSRKYKHLESDYRLTLERLENRIVLDASVDNVSSEDGSQDGNTENSTPEANVESADAVLSESPLNVDNTENPLDDIFNEEINVVLVSNAVDEVEAISEAADDDAVVIVYDSERDDLSDINSVFDRITDSGAKPIGQIAIIDHGETGMIGLSTSDPYTMAPKPISHQALVELSHFLAEDARIDLYGCNVGEGELGLQFVNYLAGATGSIVWASDDPTGNTESSDWDLEARTSESDRGFLIKPDRLADTEIELIFMPPSSPTPSGWPPQWMLTEFDFDQAYAGNEINLTFVDDAMVGADLDRLTFEAYGDFDGKTYVQNGDAYLETSANEMVYIYGEDGTTLLAQSGNLGRNEFYVFQDMNIPESKWETWTQDGELNFIIRFSTDTQPYDRAFGLVYDSENPSDLIGDNLGYQGWPNFVVMDLTLTKYPISSDGLPDVYSGAGQGNYVVDLDNYFHAPDEGFLTYSVVAPLEGAFYDSITIDPETNELSFDYDQIPNHDSTVTVRATLGPEELYPPMYLDDSFTVSLKSTGSLAASDHDDRPGFSVHFNGALEWNSFINGYSENDSLGIQNIVKNLSDNKPIFGSFFLNPAPLNGNGTGFAILHNFPFISENTGKTTQSNQFFYSHDHWSGNDFTLKHNFKSHARNYNWEINLLAWRLYSDVDYKWLYNEGGPLNFNNEQIEIWKKITNI